MITPHVAYIDPSVVSYAASAIAGVVIGVGAVAAVFFRKAKKKVKNALNIEDNTKKQVEEAVVVVDDDDDE